MAEKTSQKFRIYCAVYVIFKKDGKVLLSRRFNTGFMDGWYSLVAGHIDGKETTTAAAVREAKEEAGVEIKTEDLKFVHVTYRDSVDREYIDFFFECETWKGELTVMEKDKCDALTWFDPKELPENTIDYIKSAFDHIQKNIPFSEYIWKE